MTARFPKIVGENTFRATGTPGLLLHTLSGNTVTPVVAKGSSTPTVTRATSRYYVHHSTGDITEATSGNIGFEANGALFMSAGTNALLRSNEPNTAFIWNTQFITPTNDNVDGPDGGTNTAATVRETTDNATHRNRQNITLTADADFAITFIAKSVGGDGILLRLWEDSSFADFAGAYFEISGGTVGSDSTTGTGSVVSKSITSLGSSWYRCDVVVTIGGGHTGFRFDPYTTIPTENEGAYAGNTSNGYDVYYAGVIDDFSFPGPIIPTAGSTVTHNKEQLTYVASGNILAATGTIQFTANVLYTAQRMTFIDTRNSSGLNGVLVYMNTSGQTVFEVYNGSGVVVTLTDTANAFTAGTTKDIEVRWASEDYELKTDGVSRATNTVATGVPASHDIIRCAEDENNANELNGHLKELKIFEEVAA